MITLKSGDIFFTNNFKTGAKIVMFLMTAPTLWQYIWRAIRGTQKVPRFYHAGMILNETDMIEQQSTVRIRPIDRIFKKNYIVWRKRGLSEQEKNRLVETSTGDLGEGYGVAECIGKTVAWLTGIRWFARAFDMKDKAICVVRVAEWYKIAVGDTFGVPDPDNITTLIMDEYMLSHPDEWECIDIKYEPEE